MSSCFQAKPAKPPPLQTSATPTSTEKRLCYPPFVLEHPHHGITGSAEPPPACRIKTASSRMSVERSGGNTVPYGDCNPDDIANCLCQRHIREKNAAHGMVALCLHRSPRDKTDNDVMAFAKPNHLRSDAVGQDSSLIIQRTVRD
jgi:hypothetical protein